jgi:hypothetical protein
MAEQPILKKIHDLILAERRKLVRKMIKDRKQGEAFSEDDRVLLLKLNGVIALIKKNQAPPRGSWVQQVINEFTKP